MSTDWMHLAQRRDQRRDLARALINFGRSVKCRECREDGSTSQGLSVHLVKRILKVTGSSPSHGAYFSTTSRSLHMFKTKYL